MQSHPRDGGGVSLYQLTTQRTMDNEQYAYVLGALARLNRKMDFILEWASEQLEENDKHVTGTMEDTEEEVELSA
jgi:hypothetical protein